MKKLILVCGPAGIGKSTFCHDYISHHPDENVKIVSSDEIRKGLCGSYDKFPPHKNMTPVYEGMIKVAKTLYTNFANLTILLDTTMLYDERRLFFVKALPPFDETDLYLLKLHDWTLCLKRNKMRQKEKWVPEDVVLDMIKCYQDPSAETQKYFNNVKTFYLD